MTYSRREFGKTALAALPVSLKVFAAKVNGVTLGVMTYSLRDSRKPPVSTAWMDRSRR